MAGAVARGAGCRTLEPRTRRSSAHWRSRMDSGDYWWMMLARRSAVRCETPAGPAGGIWLPRTDLPDRERPGQGWQFLTPTRRITIDQLGQTTATPRRRYLLPPGWPHGTRKDGRDGRARIGGRVAFGRFICASHPRALRGVGAQGRRQLMQVPCFRPDPTTRRISA